MFYFVQSKVLLYFVLVYELILSNNVDDYKIPNVKTLKAKVLSDVGVKFRQFKSKFTTNYIYGERKEENLVQNMHPLMKKLGSSLCKFDKLKNGRLISLLYLNIIYINVLLNFECYDRRFETNKKPIRHIMIPHIYCPVVVISC